MARSGKRGDALFKAGDIVTEVHPTGNRTAGTVIQFYKLKGVYRYVVRFEDGAEGVFFEHELVRAP
jgi:hypothetical protein